MDPDHVSMVAELDQLRAHTRAELGKVEKMAGMPKGWSMAALLELTEQITRTPEKIYELKPGTAKMLGLLAFLGCAYLHETNVDIEETDDS